MGLLVNVPRPKLIDGTCSYGRGERAYAVVSGRAMQVAVRPSLVFLAVDVENGLSTFVFIIGEGSQGLFLLSLPLLSKRPKEGVTGPVKTI